MLSANRIRLSACCPLSTDVCHLSFHLRHQPLFTRYGGLAALRSLPPDSPSLIPAPVPTDLKYLDAALPGFIEARKIIKKNGDSLAPLGFKGEKFEFYRFAHRYRMALRFRSVELEGFGSETRKGYSGLTRIFLAWSVFERYIGLARIRHPYREFFEGVKQSEVTSLGETIKRRDPDRKLYKFLRAFLIEEKHKNALDRFQEGNVWKVIYYASALRHAYVHCHLTAFAQGIAAEDVAMICNESSVRILHWIKADFARRLENA